MEYFKFPISFFFITNPANHYQKYLSASSHWISSTIVIFFHIFKYARKILLVFHFHVFHFTFSDLLPPLKFLKVYYKTFYFFNNRLWRHTPSPISSSRLPFIYIFKLFFEPQFLQILINFMILNGIFDCSELRLQPLNFIWCLLALII